MIGMVLLLLTLGALIVTRRPRWQWAMGAALGLALWLLAGFLGVTSGWGWEGILNAAAVGAVVGTAFAFARIHKPEPTLSFEATHRHDNIAVDSAGRVWVRDMNGEEVILARSDVQQWTHRYIANGKFRARNKIEVRTNSVDRPMVTALFDRHPDTLWGAPHNAREAEEWHARLSALLR
ncbi:MAG TPA: hypothetical protein VGN46_11625 [Luteibacter sp.]|uniref:hypothetical protein n=1 Tax=Luteibacter sp. TaxID=1886636 RepID=UPI002F3EAC1F